MGYSPWGHKESDMTEQLTLWGSNQAVWLHTPYATLPVMTWK